MKIVTGCLRKIEKINICMKLSKIGFLVTNENMGLCLYMKILQALTRQEKVASWYGYRSLFMDFLH